MTPPVKSVFKQKVNFEPQTKVKGQQRWTLGQYLANISRMQQTDTSWLYL